VKALQRDETGIEGLVDAVGDRLRSGFDTAA